MARIDDRIANIEGGLAKHTGDAARHADCIVENEEPTVVGTSRTKFKIAHTPDPADSVKWYEDGTRQRWGSSGRLSIQGRDVTSSSALGAATFIVVDYRYNPNNPDYDLEAALAADWQMFSAMMDLALDPPAGAAEAEEEEMIVQAQRQRSRYPIW